MKKLLNTLFITSEDAYLTLDGENVVVNREKQEMGGFRCIDLAVYSHFRMRAHRRHSWARVRRATLIWRFALRVGDSWRVRAAKAMETCC